MPKRLPLLILFGLSASLVARSQVSSNNCSTAGLLCPNEWEVVNNFNSTIQTCLSCQDDFNLCFNPLNTSWFTFLTFDTGGEIDIEIQNVSFDNNVNNDNNSLNLAVFEASVPCFSQSYELVHCINEFDGNLSETINGLSPNTLYYVVFSGTQNGLGALEASQASFEIRISGAAVTRPPANLTFVASPTSSCAGGLVTLEVDTLGCPNFTNIEWHKNGEIWQTSLGTAFTTDELENDDVIQAFTTCYEDCPILLSSNQIAFTVYDFLVDAGSNVTIAQGQSVVLNGTTNEAIYSWTPPTGLNNPNILNPTAAPDQTTTYFLTASNGICEISDEMTVFVVEGLEIPNVFSPNGDGVNDVWEIQGTQNFNDIYVVIYDRSGQKVFESVNYNPLSFWNGNSRGRALPATTYFYTIELNRGTPDRQTIKGAVTLVR